jgi:hypothetical protein
MSHQQCWMNTTALEKKWSWLHLSAQLSDPWDTSQFLYQHNHWSSRLKPSICSRQATRLTGSISSTCDRYVQYLLTGANPLVLNWHRRELQPWRCHLPHHTSRPSQPTVSTFHVRAPPGLRLSIQSLPTKLKREQILNLMSGSLHSTSTVNYHLSIACANGNHQVIGSQG